MTSKDLGILSGWLFLSSEKNSRYRCNRCQNIAFVIHTIRHERHLGNRGVCGKCAASMTNDPETVRIREDKYKTTEQRFREFLLLRWQHSERGNLYCNYRGTNVGIYRGRDGKFQARIADKVGDRRFSDEMGALKHLFNTLLQKEKIDN